MGYPRALGIFDIRLTIKISLLAVLFHSSVQAVQVNLGLEGVKTFFKMLFEKIGSEVLVSLEENVKGGF